MSDKHADIVFLGGRIHPLNGRRGPFQALAVRDGRILGIGGDAEIKALAGPGTELVALGGDTVIPGLIDSHMHPLWGAKMLATHSLAYEPLSVGATLGRLRGFLAEDGERPDDEWLQVRAWLRIGGSDVTAADLDSLPTRRPVILFSNDCHFAALNTRGLNVLGIGRDTPDPPDGKILRGAGGAPTGIIEDGPAMRYYDSVSQVREGAAARVFGLAFEALHRQGVTTVMDTRALPESFEAARFMGSRGELGVRFLGAREVTPADCPTPGDAAQAVSRALAFVREYDGGEPGPEPGVNLRHLKFFVDGMPTNLTAYTQTPYFEDFGAPGAPDWREGTLRGAPYFTEEQLKALFVETAAQGLHPHCHIIADGAAELVINAIAAMRRAHPGKDIRPAMAHLDVLTPDQYGKIARARAVAVLSFQWCGQPEELIEFQRNLYGPVRFEGLETHGKLIDAGVTVAYGSDWPIDPLNEWGNFQVGLTRRMLGGAPDAFPRLANDRDLALGEVLAAATRNAAWALGMERHIGTLEPGKLADLAIIEGDLFARKPHEIAATRVTRTVIGGKTVFKA